MTDTATTEAAVQQAVGDVIHTIVKGVRAVQLYLPNNPMYEQAKQKIVESFRAAWQVTQEIELEVTDTEIRWQGQPMSSQPEETEQIARLLFENGMRELRFLEGVEEEEILKFLLVLTRVRTLPPDAEDDLMTLLWDEDFMYVRYEVIELGDEEGDNIGPATSSPPNAAKVREEVAQELAEAEQSSEEFTSIETSDSTLYELQPDEVAYLNQEIEREYDIDLRANVLAILFDIFEVQTGHDVRHELISILEGFLPHLLAARDFDSVIYLLREARIVRGRAKDLVVDQGERLGSLPKLLLEPDKFGQLLEAVELRESSANEAELERLFGALPTNTFETALEWLPRLKMERTRDLLEDALLQMAIAQPELVKSALTSNSEDVVPMAVRFTQTLGLPLFVPNLGALLVHEDHELRSQVVTALEAIGTLDAFTELVKALDDGVRDIRIAVVRILSERKYQGAFDQVYARVVGGEIKDADLTEKKAFFEAYGALSGPDGVSHLVPMLLPRGFMKRKEDSEIRACAAMALGKIGTPDAVAVLEQAARDKDPLVRNAIKQAIQEVK